MDTTSLYARNNALLVNPNIGGRADISITTHGSDFYYAICAVMGTVALTVMGLSFLKPQTDRIFFYITAAINATACIAYFSMGSNLGQVPITAEFQRNDPVVRGVTREIFYARYIDWFVTTPLLLMDLLLTAGMPWPSVLWTIFLDEVMIVTGLLGALTRTRFKFGKRHMVDSVNLITYELRILRIRMCCHVRCFLGACRSWTLSCKGPWRRCPSCLYDVWCFDIGCLAVLSHCMGCFGRR